MKKTLLVLIIWCVLSILVGCGAKEIQSQTYITALGIDYVDGEFIIYTQALNFANIAKQEGTSSLSQPVPILIGEAKAKSIHSALNHLEQHSPLPFYYGHVNTILLSENAIKHSLNSVIEYIGQNPFLRYNIWFLGTKENVKDILKGESFFNFPSIYTVIHNPKILTENTFSIPIREYSFFIADYYEPVGSFIIPSLSVDDSNFKEDDKGKKISTINGGYAISQQKYKGWIPKGELAGIKWVSREANNIPYTLFKEKVSLLLQDPTYKVVVHDGTTPSYHLQLKVNAQITQNEENLNYDTIKKELEKKLKEELNKTIEKSIDIQTDLLNVSAKAYRYHLDKWDINKINSIDKDSIKQIDIKINIIKTLHYKR